jgi:DAK2 domain fusion protein YloV
MASAEAGVGRRTLGDVGGRQAQAGLQSALAYLQANQDEVNDLNVFPVPDGDTGSNMYLTLRSAVEDAARVDDPTSIAAVMAAAAHGSLMGARGNSGVILSQILRGFSQGLQGRQRVDAAGLATAFGEASTVAYRAVMKPTEGTLLTVIREAAGAARQEAEREGADVRSVLEVAVTEAHAAVERTPEQLAVLRDAGVVDAGGFGLAIILEGFTRALSGGDVEETELAVHRVIEPPVRRPGDAGAHLDGVPVRRGAAAVAASEKGFGYCTEFLVAGPGLDVDTLRAELAALGESALVVGDSELVRVHIHTEDPARLITAAAQRGRLSKLKVEDMSAQHHEVLERAGAEEAALAGANGAADAAAATAPRRTLAVVSVAPGDGFRDILLGIGANRVVEGGQTMNPSTQDLLEAVTHANADNVIILPNNKNVILTAEQVDGLAAHANVRVVPSQTLPQGITALLALDPDASLDDNVARMQAALSGVTTVEVTTAVRDTVADGQQIHAGDVIALVDDRITQVGDDVAAVVEAAVKAAPTPPELITVYRGAGVAEAEAAALADGLRGLHPGVEVELHEGGQDHYPFILSLE